MEREPRLGRIERVGELADAPLAPAEPFQDAETGFVGERVEQPRRTVDIEAGSDGHTS